jgi:hypothetical protein
MTRTLKIYNGSDSSPIVDLTDGAANTDALEMIWEKADFATVADRGTAGVGSIVIRDPGGLVPDRLALEFLSSHNVVEFIDGPITVWRGRVEAQDAGRGEVQLADRYREWTLTMSDYNADLQGIVVHQWVRGAETDVARVQALAAAYLAGSPRATTNLNATTYVPNTNTVALVAETYSQQYVADVLNSIALTANKQYFVDPLGNLHYDTINSSAYQSGLRISDLGYPGGADESGVTFVPIFKGVAASEEGREEITALRYYYGNTDPPQSIFLQDVPLQQLTDYWEGIYSDPDAITAAQAAIRAANILAVQSSDALGYHCSIGPVSGALLGQIRAGQTIPFKSRAARGGREASGTMRADSFLTVHVSELHWRPIDADPLHYFADLSLERPNLAQGRSSGSPIIPIAAADNCYTWVTEGQTAGTWSVDGSVARWTATGWHGQNYLSMSDMTLPAEIVFFVTISDLTDNWAARLIDNEVDQVGLHIRRYDDTNFRVTFDNWAASLVSGVNTFSSLSAFGVRFRIEANAAYHKVWDSSGAEPGGWTGTWDITPDPLVRAPATFDISADSGLALTLDNLEIIDGLACAPCTDTFSRVLSDDWGTSEICS